MPYVRSDIPIAERNRRAARTRWDREAIAKGKETGQRIVRLDRLDPTTREIILSILSARRNAAEAPAPASGTE